MNLSYYTIDDLRLGRMRRSTLGQHIFEFKEAQDAAELYRSRPKEQVKVLGVSSGMQVLDLVRCVPLFPGDWTGEDVLVTDFLKLPLWKSEKSLPALAKRWVAELDIHYCMEGFRLLPAPEPVPDHLKDKLLLESEPEDPVSAIRWIYVAGVGWLSPSRFRKRYPPERSDSFSFPLVLKYQVEGVTEGGESELLEVSPWDFKYLSHRTSSFLERKLGKEL